MAITINGTGTITGISAGGLPDGSVTAADLAAGAITSGALPAGSILQVVQTVKTDRVTQAAATTMTDIPGMSVNITPSSTANKVLVNVQLGGLSGSTALRGITFTLLRNSTPIGLGDDPGSSNERATFTYITNSATYVDGAASYQILDSPATTSQITYKLQWQTVSNTCVLNGSWSTGTGEWNKSSSSTITAMEVAG